MFGVLLVYLVVAVVATGGYAVVKHTTPATHPQVEKSENVAKN